MALQTRPELPFTVIIEPPSGPELRAWLRNPWPWLGLLLCLGLVALVYVLHVRALHSLTQAEAGHLTIGSQPAGAIIKIDGRSSGRTPATLTVSSGSHSLAVELPGYSSTTQQLSIAAGETAQRQVTLWMRSPELLQLRPALPGTTITNAQFLADGRVAVTSALGSGGEQVWAVDASGRSQPMGPSDPKPRVAVSADGERVAYADAAADAAGLSAHPNEVWLAASSPGSHDTRLYAVQDPTSQEIADLSWAPRGAQLLIAIQRHGPDGDETQLALSAASTPGGQSIAQVPSPIVPGSFSWSPDGRSVAFLTQTQTAVSLCLAQLDGGTLHYLSDVGGQQSAPVPFAPISWSPDGSQVLYESLETHSGLTSSWFGGGTLSALIRSNPDGSEPHRVAAEHDLAPGWRPDGSMVSWVDAGSGKPVELRSLTTPTGARLAQLPLQSATEMAARWDFAHQEALLAIQRTTTVGGPEYWLVRFAPEAAR